MLECLSLGTAIIVGGFLSQIPEPILSPATWLTGLHTTAQYAADAITDLTHLQILAFLPPMFTMVAVIQTAGGFAGLIPWLLRCIKGPKSAQAATAVLGILCFIDDYTNAVVVGALAQPITDRFRISREKLAFLVDATSAPIAGLAVISTWIAYEVGLFSAISAQLELNKNGYAMFFDALPFRFYCILMIMFLFINIFRGHEFGQMRLAENHARSEPPSDSDDKSRNRTFPRTTPLIPQNPRAFVAVVPIAGLLTAHIIGVWIDGDGHKLLQAGGSLFSLIHWRVVISRADHTPFVLACAATIGLALALVCAFSSRSLTFARIPHCFLLGLKRALIPLIILPLAWSLKNCCDDLCTGPYLVALLQHRISPSFFPPAVFIIASIISFATGTSYGTMSILIPTAIPVAHALDEGTYGLITIISLGAVLDGAIFGDHCSPISDTTILSSTASACPLMNHVRTQLPYSLFVAAIALICAYLPSAFGLKSRWSLLLALLVMICLFLLITRRKKPRPVEDSANDCHQGIG